MSRAEEVLNKFNKINESNTSWKNEANYKMGSQVSDIEIGTTFEIDNETITIMSFLYLHGGFQVTYKYQGKPKTQDWNIFKQILTSKGYKGI